jgi:hypothetical protein
MRKNTFKSLSNPSLHPKVLGSCGRHEYGLLSDPSLHSEMLGSCGRHKDGLIVHEQVLALPWQRQRVNQNGVLGTQCVADARSAHRLQMARRCWWR